ncbi:hypothetical protein NP233_g13107 [Leucocoprinus birnbaumii]|uniref:Uncharacterized protein n=1 Tax=Leucocoprinus birnbaumii TaxID=56174 RepID=A0AAD5YMG3_9AGAR|nr:hypothetical protein NP233_g13107 [Leucocoprinus birnbaumii]
MDQANTVLVLSRPLDEKLGREWDRAIEVFGEITREIEATGRCTSFYEDGDVTLKRPIFTTEDCPLNHRFGWFFEQEASCVKWPIGIDEKFCLYDLLDRGMRPLRSSFTGDHSKIVDDSIEMLAYTKVHMVHRVAGGLDYIDGVLAESVLEYVYGTQPLLLGGTNVVRWRRCFPIDHVIGSPTANPFKLTLYGTVAGPASRLGPLGDYNRGCSRLAKAELRIALRRPDSEPDGIIWDDSLKALKELQLLGNTADTAYTSSTGVYPLVLEDHYIILKRPVFVVSDMIDYRQQGGDQMYKLKDMTSYPEAQHSFMVDPALSTPNMRESGISDDTKAQVLDLFRLHYRFATVEAFGSDGAGLPRWQLEHALRDKYVKVEFKLGHISSTWGDHYVALWEQIRVINTD